MNAYNEAYSIEQCLDFYGFKWRGKKWGSPHSESGNAQLIAGEKWTSFHGSDAEARMGNEGEKGERFGDFWDLYKFFEHGNIEKAALIATGNMFMTSSGKTINKQQQINYNAALETQAPQVDIDMVRNEHEITWASSRCNAVKLKN